MESEDILERLMMADVLEETSDNLVLSDSFRDRIDDRRENTTIDQSPGEGGELIEMEDRLQAVFDGDARRMAIFHAVSDVTDSLDYVERVNTVALVEQFLDGFPPTEGVPTAFTPVHASQVSYLATVYPQSIVYVWRRDCDPCDVMREEFDHLFESHPPDLGLFAVFGPDDPETLEDDYQTVAGPTTLFLKDGEVDCRLLGAHHRAALKTEINLLRS